MYNFLAAFVICGIVILFGDFISRITKAWIPSVFASAVLILLGYWTVIPASLVKDSFLIPFGATLGIFLLITHLGTIISVKQLMAQWRAALICLSGLAGMVVLCYFVAPFFMDRALVIAGLPPLTGGIVAATMMQTAATKAGLTVAAVFAIAMYCVQGFAGYPLTAICLKREGARLLEGYRKGELTLSEEDMDAVHSATKLGAGQVEASTVRLPLQLPESWNSPTMVLTKLGVVAWLALEIAPYTKISAAIWALLLGIIFCRLGFLDRNSLVKANSAGIMMFALTMYIFDGLKDCTPEMLGSIIGPMITLIVIGLVGMFFVAYFVAKALKVSVPLAFANCLTALYGYPFDQIITIQTCDALTKDPQEHAFLMSRMFPAMIVSGFVTVTITSVIIAGIFVNML